MQTPDAPPSSVDRPEGGEASPPPSRKRRGRWRRWALIATLALGLLYLLREPLVHPVLTRIVGAAAPRFGYQIEIDDLDGTWFGNLSARGVTVRPADTEGVPGTLRSLTADEIGVRYSLVALVRGASPLGAVETRGVSVELDLTAAPDAVPIEDESAARFPALPDLPRLNCRDVNVLVRVSPERTLTIEKLALVTDPASGHALVTAHELREEVDGTTLRSGRLEASVHTADGVLFVSDMTLSQPGNLAEIGALRIPHGDLESVLREMSGTFAIRITELDGIVPREDSTSVGPPEHQLELAGAVSEGAATITRGFLELAGGRLTLARGRVDLAPNAQGEQTVSAELTARFENLAPLAELLNVGPGAGSLTGDVTIDGTLRALEAHVDLTGEGVLIANLPLGSVSVAADATADRIEISELKAHSPRLSASITGTLDPRTNTLDDVQLSAEVEQLDEVLTFLRPGGRVTISAELNGPLTRPVGQVNVEGTSLAIGDVPFDEFTLAAKTDEKDVRVNILRFQSPYGRVDAAFALPWPADDGVLIANVSALGIEKDFNDLRLARPTRVTIDRDFTVTCEGLTLAGRAGSIDAAFLRSSELLSVEAALQDLDLTAFLAPHLPQDTSVSGLTGQITVERGLNADGVLGETLIKSTGQLANLGFLEQSLALAWSAQVEGSTLRVENFSVLDGDLRVLELNGELPIGAPTGTSTDPVRLTGKLVTPPDRALLIPGTLLSVAMRGTCDFDLGGHFEHVTGRLVLNADELTIEGDRTLEQFLPGASAININLILGSAIELERLEVRTAKLGTLTASGRLDRKLNLQRLIDEGISSLEDAPLALTGDLDLDNIAWLSEAIESIRRLDGSMSGELALRGTLSAPEITGSLELAGGELRLAANIPTLEDLNGSISLAEKRIEIKRLDGQMGASPFSLTGAVDLAGEAPQVELRLLGQNLLFQRTRTVRLRADTDVTIAGPLDALHATGKLGLRNGRLGVEIDLLSMLEGGPAKPTDSGVQLFSLREPPLSTLTFDLNIETVEPFKFTSNLARSELRIDLELGGTGEVPTPIGRIFLDETRVKLPAGTLEFPAGIVTFEKRDPFTPQLELNGETRLAGYDVSVSITGAYDKPTVQLSSSPSLPGDELLLLVLTGQPPSGNFKDEGAQAAQAVTLYLAKDLLGRLAGGGDINSDKESLLDRLQVVTGREVSKSGVLTTEVSYRLLREAIYAGDTLYLIADRDVFEDYNMGLRLVFRFE